MTDTEQILIEMGAGFGKIHDRLNDIAVESSTVRMGCSKRFGEIEKEVGIRTAVNGEKDKAKARKVDFQSFLVRTALVLIIAGLGTVIWKIFLGHISLIIQ